MMSIGDLSKATGVKVPTIRYYEQIGMIDPPARSEGNQRRYCPADRDRLTFIRHARQLGLPLSAIRDLIELSKHPQEPCKDANRIAQEHLGAVEAKIAQLERLRRELKRIAEGCKGGTVDECYVIEALNDHGLCASRHE